VGDYSAAFSMVQNKLLILYAPAQTFLGIIYSEGKGTKQDLVEAVRYFRLASESGEPYAQFMLGNMCWKGAGTAQDRVEAIRWLEAALAQGHEDAKDSLRLIRKELQPPTWG
jgi:TPR repeat protein